MRCTTVVENDEATKAIAMMANPATDAERLRLGNCCSAANMKGDPRYMIPVASVPMVAIFERSAENCSWVL